MEAPIIGAFLFGFGLFTIINFNFNLYTGKIGYLGKNLPIIYLGNLIGAALVGLVLPFTRIAYLTSIAATLCEIKIADTLLSHFILSFFCGMLMFIAVEGSKKFENPIAKTLIVFLAVVIFILSGFEHCIANIFYFSAASQINSAAAMKLLIATLGNSLGSLFISLPKRKFLD